MDTVGRRLKGAVSHWASENAIGHGVKEFSARMQGRGVKGYAVPSLYSYFRDEVSPTVEFLATAADVLAIRLAWLAAGDGEMTEAIQNARSVRPPSEGEREPPPADESPGVPADHMSREWFQYHARRGLAEYLNSQMGTSFEPFQLWRGAADSLVDSFVSFLATDWAPGAGDGESELRKAAEWFLNPLLAPLTEFGSMNQEYDREASKWRMRAPTEALAIFLGLQWAAIAGFNSHTRLVAHLFRQRSASVKGGENETD